MTFHSGSIWLRRGDLMGEGRGNTILFPKISFPKNFFKKIIQKLRAFVVNNPPFLTVDPGTGAVGGHNMELVSQLVWHKKHRGKIFSGFKFPTGENDEFHL